MDNRKNTILLTVIAVATLLVAVVGATFAYFTAQGGTTTTANATVKTETADSSSFETKALVLNADQESFAAGKGNAVSTTAGSDATGKAEFTASTAADGNFCYTVKFEVTANDFGYKPLGTDPETYGTDPELLLTIKKNDTVITSGVTNLTYKENIVGANVVTDPTGNPAGTAQDPIAGWDITEFGKTATATATVKDGANEYHMLSATKGTKVVDNWTFTATLVNYGWDQNYNAGKTLAGSIVFDKSATCPSPTPSTPTPTE